MSLGTNSLLAYCTQLCENTRGGLDWLLANEAELKQDLAGPVRELRKAVVEGRRLQRAAGRKMCVGVFGPSQTGKSYLISALAREGTKPVMADFGGDYVDFLADINPQGGKESTGLVTRFTIDRPDSVPPGYPVELRLLTETDVVKVLANSYVFDVNRDDEDEASHSVEAIQTLLARLEGRARAETVGTLDPVDIVDLEEYCNRRLVKSPRVKVLRRTDFWRVATRIAHRLDGSDRSELFAIIWDGLPAFTNVYRRLHLVLERFDFAESVFASYDALRDRATSIITVDTLAGIGEGRGDGVEVTTRSGRRSTVLRNELAAVTAELRIVMRDLPFDFFRHTDLLDFPGYRSRMSIAKLPEYIQQNGMRELMIRGKVAYLFERYSDEQELTSMLLCQGPENFEVSDLPPVVYDWIRNTHGASPADRSVERTSLFFIQTKADMVFQQSAGKAEDASRFIARLENNLLQSYGKQAYENGGKAWPMEWTPGRPFQKLFLLRNPAIVQDNMFDYEEAGGVLRERALRGDKVGYVDRLRQAFIEDATIRQHYGSPEAAWDAMMELNDGGVRRIAEELRPVCDPRTKAAQVAARAGRLAEEVRARLQPYHYSGDIVEQKKKKRVIAARLSDRLKRCFDRERFGELLDILQLRADDLYDLYEVVERRPVIEECVAALAAEPEPEAEAADDSASFLDSLLSDEPAPVQARVEKAGSASVLDLPSRYALAIEQAWIEQLNSLGDNPALLRYFDVTKQDWVNLTQELQTAARRLALSDAMRQAIERGASFRQIPKSALIWKQAKPAAAVLNDFLAHLGVGGKRAPGGREIQIDSRRFVVFPPRSVAGGEPVLEQQALRYDRTFFQHWLLCLVRLAEDNVEFEAGSSINIAQNERLGGLLASMQGAAPAAA